MIHKIALIMMGTVISYHVYADDIACLKTNIEKGNSCNNLFIKFDFADCNFENLTIKTVRSKCVNQKAVAYVKEHDTYYIATYGEPIKDNSSDGQGWRFLSVRKEIRKTSASISNSTDMSVTIKKIPSIHTEVTVEEMPKPDADARVVIAPVSAPSSMREEIFPKVKIEPPLKEEKRADENHEVQSEIKVETNKTEAKADNKTEIKTDIIVPEAPKVTLRPSNLSELKTSGFIDFYYLSNSNAPSVPSAASSTNQFVAPGNNPYRMFDNYHDNFILNFASISLKKESAKTGGRLDFGFGNGASTMSPLDGASQNILQAHMYYKFNDRIKIRVGKMISHMGIEDVYGLENMNYSRSLLFTFGIPLWHTGLALETVLIPDKINMNFYSYNSWSGLYNNNRKTGGLRFSYTPSKNRSFNYNFITHTESNSNKQIRQVHELNYQGELRENIFAIFDSIFGYETRAFTSPVQDAQWNALMLGLQWKFNRYTFSPRVEYFYDPQGYAIEGLMGTSSTPAPYISQNIMSYTLTNSWDVDVDGKIIFELRNDTSDSAVFRNADGTLIKSQTTAVLSFMLGL